MSKPRLVSNTSNASNSSNVSKNPSTSRQVSGSEKSDSKSATKSQFFSPLKMMLDEVDKEIQHIKINMYAHPPRKSTGKLHSLKKDIYPNESPSKVEHWRMSRWEEEELLRKRDVAGASAESRAGVRRVSLGSRGMSDKQDPKVRFLIPARKGSPTHPSLDIQAASIKRVFAWLTQCNQAMEGQDQEVDNAEEWERGNMSVVSLDGIDYERPQMDVKLWTRVKGSLTSSFSRLGRSYSSRRGSETKSTEPTYGRSVIGQRSGESTTTNRLPFIDPHSKNETSNSNSKAVLKGEGAMQQKDFMPLHDPFSGKAQTTMSPPTNKTRSKAFEAIQNMARRRTLTSPPDLQKSDWVVEGDSSHSMDKDVRGGTRKEPRHAHVTDSYKHDRVLDDTYFDENHPDAGSFLSSRSSEINMGSIIGKSRGEKSVSSGNHEHQNHRLSPRTRRRVRSSKASCTGARQTEKIFKHLERNETRRLSHDSFVPAAPEPLPLERPHRTRNHYEVEDDNFVPAAPEPLPLKEESKKHSSRVERQRILDEEMDMQARRASGRRRRVERKAEADQSTTERPTNKSPKEDRKRSEVIHERERGPSENVLRRRAERVQEGKARDYNVTERTKYWGQ
ncbi:hypothetical protein HYALB_00012148 [Hymenoscyphus albidus]|uniref:Uncharacterized protein n=1 Tax=Hymenoscyphus albidus TaxID=595503 RepID=A0A9N9LQX9_9HELO|nr:hypothetical protein HYALB_00012148 [Hymenoscyphus albidus]